METTRAVASIGFFGFSLAGLVVAIDVARADRISRAISRRLDPTSSESSRPTPWGRSSQAVRIYAGAAVLVGLTDLGILWAVGIIAYPAFLLLMVTILGSSLIGYRNTSRPPGVLAGPQRMSEVIAWSGLILLTAVGIVLGVLVGPYTMSSS